MKGWHFNPVWVMTATCMSQLPRCRPRLVSVSYRRYYPPPSQPVVVVSETKSNTASYWYSTSAIACTLGGARCIDQRGSAWRAGLSEEEGEPARSLSVDQRLAVERRVTRFCSLPQVYLAQSGLGSCLLSTRRLHPGILLLIRARLESEVRFEQRLGRAPI